MKVAQSCPTLRPHGMYTRLLRPLDFPGKSTRVGCHFLLQRIFPTQGLNPGLPHCRWLLYQLNHREVQEYWSGKSIPSLGDLPDPGIEPGSPTLQADSLPTELSGKPYSLQVEVTKLSPLEERINISPKGNIPQPTFKLPH